MPVFFQGSLDASPLRSSVDILPQATVIAPFAFVAGLTIQLTSRYIPVNGIGWVIMIVGMGLLTLLKPSITAAQLVGYQLLSAIGVGIGVRKDQNNIATPLTFLLVHLHSLSDSCPATCEPHGFSPCVLRVRKIVRSGMSPI